MRDMADIRWEEEIADSIMFTDFKSRDDISPFLASQDEKVNRMDESLKLFDEMINIEYFHKTPFIVFFNKRDLFEEKVKRKSIR